jgi:hypothetical protein
VILAVASDYLAAAGQYNIQVIAWLPSIFNACMLKIGFART